MDGARADIAVIEATGAAVPPGPTAETRPEPPPLIASVADAASRSTSCRSAAIGPERARARERPDRRRRRSAIVDIVGAGRHRDRRAAAGAQWSASAAGCSKASRLTSDELAIALAPARRGRLALPDARRAGAGGGLHRCRRRRGHRRRPPGLPEPADRVDPRLRAAGVHRRSRALAEPHPSRGPSEDRQPPWPTTGRPGCRCASTTG